MSSVLIPCATSLQFSPEKTIKRRTQPSSPLFLRAGRTPVAPPPHAHQPLEVTFLTSRLSWGRTARSGVSSSRHEGGALADAEVFEQLFHILDLVAGDFENLFLWLEQDRHVGYFKRQRLIHCYPFFMRICPGMGTSEYVASRQKESLPIGKEGLSRNGGPDLLTPAPLSLSVMHRNASSTGAYKRIHPAGL